MGHHDLPFLWIDVGLVDAAWKLDTHLWVPVGAGAYWDQRAPAELPMPIVAFDDDGGVRFQDGRHRFAWMRDKGARRLPVSIVAGVDIARFGGRRTP